MVSLTAGGDIVNQAGGRIAGGTVIASAARDILAQGGSSISGGNILLSAGPRYQPDRNHHDDQHTSERKDLRQKGRFARKSSSTTQTVTGAEIAATGNARRFSAGRDLTLTAAKVSAGGDASLSGRSRCVNHWRHHDRYDRLQARQSKKASARARRTAHPQAAARETFNGTS